MATFFENRKGNLNSMFKKLAELWYGVSSCQNDFVVLLRLLYGWIIILRAKILLSIYKADREKCASVDSRGFFFNDQNASI